MSTPNFLGPYEIGKTIGRGGMGRVYEGRHVKSGDKVAVKLVANHLSDEQAFRRRFEKEIRALSLLRHANIVDIIGVGEEAGQLFYSMELVKGESLQAKIRRSRKLPWKEAVEIALQICSAVRHAHDVGVFHRDLKPANVLLTTEGTVKIVDFGILRQWGDSSNDTHSGAIIGTPDYMAPEQATTAPITPATDFYALGSVLYAMLVGRAPFRGKNATEVIDALQRDPPMRLDAIDSSLPKPLVDLVHHLLQKEPSRRPGTIRLITEALGELVDKASTGETRIDDGSSPELADSPTMEVEGDMTRFGAALGSTEPAAPREAESSGNRGNRDSFFVVTSTTPLRRTKVESGDSRSDPMSSITGLSGVDQDGGNDLDLEADERQSKTYFQLVDRSTKVPELSKGQHAGRSEESKASLVLTSVAIIMLLALTGWAISVAVTPPTADELFQRAISQQDQDAARSFVTRFDEDPRRPEVESFLMQERLAATQNRLRAKAKIGISPLSAAEDSFLSVMQTGVDSPAEYEKKLRAWRDAFTTGSEEAAIEDPAIMKLHELVRFELKRVTSSNDYERLDPRASDLMVTLQAIASDEDPNNQKRRLLGLIETLQDKAWAASVLEIATERLQALDDESESPQQDESESPQQAEQQESD